jgi:hypothetical protein
MTCRAQLHVEVLNYEIIVILPATSYGVVYYKPATYRSFSSRISYRGTTGDRPSPRRSFSLELGRQLMPKRVSLAGLFEKTTHEGKTQRLPEGQLVTEEVSDGDIDVSRRQLRIFLANRASAVGW